MASVNKVILIGNLGRDPETRFTVDGSAVANLSVATNSSWKNKQGEKVEETEFHRITAFGKLAEICGKYLKKGSQIYLEGRLKTQKYTDKSGVEKFSTGIVMDQMQMLGGRPEQSGQAPRQSSPAPQQKANQSPSGGFDDMDDDIPF